MKYSELCKRLKDSGIENYLQEAEILIEEFCGFVSDAHKPLRHASVDSASSARARSSGTQHSGDVSA